jgi:hypothetical protein
MALFGWLAGCQPAVLFSHIISTPTTSQPTVFFSHNKSAPATSQPNEAVACIWVERFGERVALSSRDKGKLVGPCASIINVCLRQAGHELDLALANSVTMCIIFILPNFIVMYIMFLVLK